MLSLKHFVHYQEDYTSRLRHKFGFSLKSYTGIHTCVNLHIQRSKENKAQRKSKKYWYLTRTDYLDKRPKRRNVDMRFGLWILESWVGVMWTGLAWLRIGTGEELL
jgi:hypothetical protein